MITYCVTRRTRPHGVRFPFLGQRSKTRSTPIPIMTLAALGCPTTTRVQRPLTNGRIFTTRSSIRTRAKKYGQDEPEFGALTLPLIKGTSLRTASIGGEMVPTEH